MNKVKKVFVLVLIAAIFSFGMTGCKKKTEPPAKETSTKETAPAEHPGGEHPVKEDPAKEQPE